jgi:hypothetical protein
MYTIKNICQFIQGVEPEIIGGWGLCIAKNMIHLSYESMDASFMVQLLSTKDILTYSHTRY